VVRRVLVILLVVYSYSGSAVAQQGEQLRATLNEIEVNARAIESGTEAVGTILQEASTIQAYVQALPALLVGQPRFVLDLAVRLREDSAQLGTYASNDDTSGASYWSRRVLSDVNSLRAAMGLPAE
jgi:hypothetical protein